MSVDAFEIPDVDENQLIEVFQTISTLIIDATKESPDLGGETLASIHYKLFKDFNDSKQQKSRLAIMFLQSQLGSLISQTGKEKDVGLFIMGYTRHWLKFVLIFESEMASFLSWYTFNNELSLNMVPYISRIEELLPLAVNIENNPGLPENVIKEFQEFSDASNDDAGEELKNWLQNLMREALFYEDSEAKSVLVQFQKSFADLMQVDPQNVEFNTLFHQYGESWYNEIKKRKIWLDRLIKELDLYSDQNLSRLIRGYYWRKFSGKPLRLALRQRGVKA
jgi:hypothetical protein